MPQGRSTKSETNCLILDGSFIRDLGTVLELSRNDTLWVRGQNDRRSYVSLKVERFVEGILNGEAERDELTDVNPGSVNHLWDHLNSVVHSAVEQTWTQTLYKSLERMTAYWEHVVAEDKTPEGWQLRYLVELLPAIASSFDTKWPEKYKETARDKIARIYTQVVCYVARWISEPDTSDIWPEDASLKFDDAKETVKQAIRDWASAFELADSEFGSYLTRCLGVRFPKRESLPQVIYRLAGDHSLIQHFLDAVDARIKALDALPDSEEKWNVLYTFLDEQALELWRICEKFYNSRTGKDGFRELSSELARRILWPLASLVGPDNPALLQIVARVVDLFQLNVPGATRRDDLSAVFDAMTECYENSWRVWANENAAFDRMLRDLNGSVYQLRAAIDGNFRGKGREIRWEVEVDSVTLHDEFARFCRRDAVLPFLDPTTGQVDAEAIKGLPSSLCSIHNKSSDCRGFCLAVRSASVSNKDARALTVHLDGAPTLVTDCVLCLPFDREEDGGLQWLIVDFEPRGNVRAIRDDRERIGDGEDISLLGVQVKSWPSENIQPFSVYYRDRFFAHTIDPSTA